MSNITKQFAQVLKTSRQLQGLSQEELAEKVGLSRASIANYEGGLQGISLEHALLLAFEVGFSLDEFMRDQHKLIEEKLEVDNVAPKLKEAILKTLKEE